jgi:hypothetical protein
MTKEPKKAPNRGNAKRPTAAKKQTEKAVTKPYEPTQQELAAAEAFLGRRKDKRPAPWMKVSNTAKAATLSLDHEDQQLGLTLLMGATGTTSASFLDGLLRQLANAASQGQQVSEDDLNFMLSVVKGTEPEDEVESMLAAQMAAVHMATMSFARRLTHVETLAQQDSAERAFNKLARTFAAQVEALKKYRTGGEQKVTVEHVHVHQGGQAIVGTVANSPGGGRAGKNSKATP